MCVYISIIYIYTYIYTYIYIYIYYIYIYIYYTHFCVAVSIYQTSKKIAIFNSLLYAVIWLSFQTFLRNSIINLTV